MKKFILLFLPLAWLYNSTNAQECVDPTLIDPMAICPMIYMPVCGCDGVTYSNSCVATTQGGVTSWTNGECPMGGCVNLADVDFGLCDMYLGVGWNGVNCMGFSGCGYVSNGIDYSPYFFETFEDCVAQCGGGIGCINPSQIIITPCPLIYMPVCGCDGVTYGNSCEAYYGGGVTSYSPGACGEVVYCPQIPEFVNFGECAMFLGIARINGSCVAVSGCGYVGSNGYDYTDFFFDSEEECNGQCSSMCPDPSVINLNMGCLMIYDPVCGCDNITYSNDCVAYYHHGITMYTPGECIVGVDEKLLNSLILYPNPTNDLLTIQSDYSGAANIIITDILGKEISRQSYGNIKYRQIDVNTLASGSYLLHVITKSGLRKPIHFVKE